LSLIKLHVDVEVKQEEVPNSQQIQLETQSSTGEKEHEDVHEEAPT
jgi:hypothetical protein